MGTNPSAKRQRLDLRLLELGMFSSREAAQTAIIDGGILVDGQRVTKPGTAVSSRAYVELSPGWGPPKYASRGGLKLEKALSSFAVDPSGRVCLDIGASTGGFTDCLLKHGALRVYAIDVGYGQLDWRLRQDPNVLVRERLNARHLTPELLYKEGEAWADLAVIDVSFISIIKILPALIGVLGSAKPEIVALIKPQFEAGRSLVDRGGVVKSPAVHEQVIRLLLDKARSLGLASKALTYSPVRGPAGNIEYLVHWLREEKALELNVANIVSEAHQALKVQ